MDPRPAVTHVFIIDGTLSRLSSGHETNAGLLYKLLEDQGPLPQQTVGYDRGIQGEGRWRTLLNAAAGLTINLSIRAGYAHLSRVWQPGDRVMLFGYSRGAYAARSLAGFIGRIGLLRARHATGRRVLRAFRYYEEAVLSPQAYLFSTRYCHRSVPIAFMGVWDTVSALGLPYPLISRLAPMATEFHDTHLGDHVRAAYQALALDETRTAYRPMPWSRLPDWEGELEQAWFAGSHADVGGQVSGFPQARPLSNIALVWMLEKAEAHGLILPEGWQERFPTDPAAPAFGTRRGMMRYFVSRAPRVAGQHVSEIEHPSVAVRRRALPRYAPKARWDREGD